ncbi:Beta-hexosaminidase [Desulfonema limicola]|uniref:Beta-hexosaminidase n=1 Tax=Desulfonema limicola TaxID=45656 RepID=A0A975GJ04_9BACT|nr:beta-N-acetylhexosaminidase [Desulfonema limicola]QTA83006.1 Beta-hexosaminidase [Desulfonema limicola]
MDTKTFSDKQLAGQRLMIGFDGTMLNPDLEYSIKELKIGGIILFSRNIESPSQLKNLCQSVQSFAQACSQPPLFISIDQEGGKVARLKEPFTCFPGNPSIKNKDDALNFARITASELSKTGINMNMAPVMDVSPKDMNSIMTGRTFSHDPEIVSRLGTAVIREMQAGGVMAVAKHFPGIGRTIIDSHLDLPFMDADLADIQSFDIPPFYAAAACGAAGIMLSHILYTRVDPVWPASLSIEIAKKLLRDEMGFDGLVITDDLDMGAVKKHYKISKMIEQILKADIDITLICHKGPDIETAFEEILKQFKNNHELRERGIISANRIMRFKQQYCKSQFPDCIA